MRNLNGEGSGIVYAVRTHAGERERERLFRRSGRLLSPLFPTRVSTALQVRWVPERTEFGPARVMSAGQVGLNDTEQRWKLLWFKMQRV